MVGKVIVGLIAGSCAVAVLAILGAVFFLLGWNIFVSPVFSFPTITFWQALCAMLLIGIVGSVFKSDKG